MFDSFAPATLTSEDLDAAGMLQHGDISKIWIAVSHTCVFFFFSPGMSDFSSTLLPNTRLALQHVVLLPFQLQALQHVVLL